MILKDNFKGPHHLGIKTADAKGIAEWYQENLGFTYREKHVLKGNPELLLIFIGKGNLVLEFIQEKGGLGFDSLTHGMWDHFAMKCSDLKRHLARIRDRGISIVEADGDEPNVLANFMEKGVAYFTAQSPNGEKFEFNSDLASSGSADPQGRDWAHLGHPVADLSKSEYYYSQLGFSVHGRGYADSPEGQVEARFLELDGFIIELYQLAGRDLEAVRNRKSGIIDHVCLETERIADAVDGLKAAGLADESVSISSIELSGITYKNCFITGPDGEKIELWQS